ncbi:LOW QUALITY PROTEIN: A-kinase anchor protein 3 [Pluvialis apricaria]
MLSQKHFGQHEFASNLSKDILIYANNVVCMVISVMKTMEGQGNDSNIACSVLNLLLKHSKTMVSDLIDSFMKNLRDIAGRLLTNSDFSSSVKLTLFTLGSHKAAEIVQATLNHFHTTLIVQTPGGECLAYAFVKTGSRTDASLELRSAATKTETLPKEKETCADAVGNHIIKQGFTLCHESQNQCIQCSTSQPRRELKQDTEQSCEEAVSGLTKMLTDQLDLSRQDSSSAQFVCSLVDIVLKLCLMIVKYSNPESLLAESGSREAVGSKGTGTADSMAAFRKGTVAGHRVVVVNQNPSENACNNAFLQGIIASQTDLPVLHFLDGDEFLNKLQKLSSVAVEKGYKVGEILQAMLKYKKERQPGEAVGN